jgi:hypothetical protein
MSRAAEASATGGLIGAANSRALASACSDSCAAPCAEEIRIETTCWGWAKLALIDLLRERTVGFNAR